jgi:glycosyltransferase involved in cell wall biosynthesis
MNIQIITSSYPAFPGDPGGTAGLFVRSFAKALAQHGHTVVVQPIARKEKYQKENDVIIEPIPWGGGDQVLASINFFSLKNLANILRFFRVGKENVIAVHRKYRIDKTICMWIIPCGVFGYWIKKVLNKDYDLWALGSDIWRVRRIPVLGRWLIKKISSLAARIYADGVELSRETTAITDRTCAFLASNRKLPKPNDGLSFFEPREVIHFLFVGRYHRNKGPDLLIRAVSLLDEAVKKQIRVHIFGTGPLEAKLYKLQTRFLLKDIVRIGGPLCDQDFSDYLSRVSFLVIPSRVESIPLVFSDALQVHTPVISMPVGDLPELIKKYNCGLLADKVSPVSLAKAMTMAVHVGKEPFLEGVKHAVKQFDVDESAVRWLNEEFAVNNRLQERA